MDGVSVTVCVRYPSRVPFFPPPAVLLSLLQEAMLKRALKAQHNQHRGSEDGESIGAGGARRDSLSTVSMANLTVPNVMTQTTLPGTSLMGGGVLIGGDDFATVGGGGVSYGPPPGAVGVRDDSLPQYPVVRARGTSVPPLCWRWVSSECPGGDSKEARCPYKCRHYFISRTERASALHSRLLGDAVLERRCVSRVCADLCRFGVIRCARCACACPAHATSLTVARSVALAVCACDTPV